MASIWARLLSGAEQELIPVYNKDDDHDILSVQVQSVKDVGEEATREGCPFYPPGQTPDPQIRIGERLEVVLRKGGDWLGDAHVLLFQNFATGRDLHPQGQYYCHAPSSYCENPILTQNTSPLYIPERKSSDRAQWGLVAGRPTTVHEFIAILLSAPLPPQDTTGNPLGDEFAALDGIPSAELLERLATWVTTQAQKRALTAEVHRRRLRIIE